jgi:hypothetical protein
MTTPLTRPVRRKVSTLRGDDLVVALEPFGLVFREPRRRRAFVLPYGVAFQRAVELAVRADRAERLAERQRRRALRRAGGRS